MCCGAFIAKYALFFFNLACTFIGLAFVVIGIVAITNISELVELVPVNLNLIPISIIVFGSVVFLISFLGCWGAVRERGCMLVLYSVIMLILAGLKIWLAVVLFRNLNGLQASVTDWLNRAFADSNLRNAFTVMETSFKCCGTIGAQSYVNIAMPVPGSCCGQEVTQACEASSAFEGCTTLITDYLQSYGDVVGGVVITVIIIEVIAMIMGLFLNHTISRKRTAIY